MRKLVEIQSTFPEIEILVNREFQKFQNINLQVIQDLLFLSNAVERIAIIQIQGGDITCLNHQKIQYPDKKIPGILVMLREISACYKLPNTLFAINLLDEARVLELDDYPAISIPFEADYATLVRKKGIRPDALSHPAIFSPLPHALFHKQIPIFSFSKIRDLHSDILFPALGIYNISKNYQKDPISWTAKKSEVFWRGSTTGGWLRLKNWQEFPRIILSQITRALPNFDIGISTIVQTRKDEHEPIRAALQKAGIFKKYEPFEKNYRYKYLIDIDGNSFSSRLKYFLASNSVVIKTPVIWEEYYHAWLTPGKHFIPVLADPVDLQETLAWAEENPRAAKTIVHNAQNFFARYLSFDFLAAYVATLLWKYHELSEQPKMSEYSGIAKT